MERERLLAQTALFHELSEAELARVARLCRSETFQPGCIIEREGDEAHYLYVVERGCVSLEMTVRWGPGGTCWQWPIEVVTSGESFAWSALVKPHVLTATSRPLVETSVLKIEGAAMSRLLDRHPRIGRAVMEGLTEVVSSRLRSSRRTASQSVAIFSHDLKTPLAAVEYINQVILGGYAGPLTLDQEDMLRRSSRRIQHLLALLNDLLEAAQIDKGLLAPEFCVMPVAPIIARCVQKEAPRAAAKGVGLETDIPDGLGELWMAPLRLEQALNELLDNALKFTPAGGSIRTTARLVGTGPAAEALTIEVTDTGVGVPDFEQPLIFGDCYRGQCCGEVDGPGTGMGLAIARRIVDAHGGALLVESPPPGQECGSTFRLVVPRRPLGLEAERADLGLSVFASSGLGA